MTYRDYKENKALPTLQQIFIHCLGVVGLAVLGWLCVTLFWIITK